MEFTIIQIRSLGVYDPTSKNIIAYPGWAFVDKEGHTIIQCYGKNKKDLIEKILSNETYI